MYSYMKAFEFKIAKKKLKVVKDIFGLQMEVSVGSFDFVPNVHCKCNHSKDNLFFLLSLETFHSNQKRFYDVMSVIGS